MPAPDFTVVLSSRNRVGLSDYRGQPLLLVFLRHLA